MWWLVAAAGADGGGRIADVALLQRSFVVVLAVVYPPADNMDMI